MIDAIVMFGWTFIIIAVLMLFLATEGRTYND